MSKLLLLIDSGSAFRLYEIFLHPVDKIGRVILVILWPPIHFALSVTELARIYDPRS